MIGMTAFWTSSLSWIQTRFGNWICLPYFEKKVPTQIRLLIMD